MEGELISVIIPVYRVEPYLEKCVQSVLAQTYRDLEVILVDDGSPDGCPAMCDAFAARDDRVRVIHKENGGQGSARNRGLDIARGAYIGFVDSDDYIAPDMYEKLYTALTGTGADLAICDSVEVDESGGETRRYPPFRPEVIDTVEALTRMADGQGRARFVTVWNRLYSRRVLERDPFPENRRYEDMFMTDRMYERCGKIVIVPEVLYYYVQREGSTMHLPVDLKDLDFVDGYLERYDRYRRRGLNKLASKALRRAYVQLWAVVTQLDMRQTYGQVWPRMRRVLAGQIRRLDPRAALLALRYTAALVFGNADKTR